MNCAPSCGKWLNEAIVSLHLFSVTHSDQGLDAVARAARRVRDSGALVRGIEHVEGSLVLSTCNRLDVYVDISAEAGGDAQETVDQVRARLEVPGASPSQHEGREALTHLFTTACGLESMVVGEREIIGQVRRAAEAARREGCLSGLLARAVERASAVSRQVARDTQLAGAGRSVVTVALELVERSLPPLSTCTVLLAGTGSYAGAVVAALREREVRRIGVHSASGRSACFARSHGLAAVDDAEFTAALAGADLVVCCRGSGDVVLTRDLVAAAVGGGRLAILDLALTGDVPRDVADLPGVTRIDLDSVREAVPATQISDLDVARGLVAAGVEGFLAEERARSLDPAVVALRRHVARAVEDEVARMSGGRIGHAPDRETERALRHLAARFVHEPSRRAHEAAAQGRSQEYLQALDLVFGIHPE